MDYNLGRFSPGGGIGIRGRLRAYALLGVEVRVLSRALEASRIATALDAFLVLGDMTQLLIRRCRLLVGYWLNRGNFEPAIDGQDKL